jgi:hypothetical protein
MNANVKFAVNPKDSKSVAIIQSNYIPWKGYFDLIAAVDVFVIYDDMQFTRRDWRNRNQIKTPTGLQWLTVPVLVKGKYLQRINETRIDGTDWAKAHWKTITHNYSKTPFFKEISDWLAPFYLEGQYSNLSALNSTLIKEICSYLNIKTVIRDSNEFRLEGDKSGKLLKIAKTLEADRYLTGPSAQAYLDTSIFEQSGITVDWFDYSNYRIYPQAWGDFTHHVSVIDLLFNCGPNARQFMKY